MSKPQVAGGPGCAPGEQPNLLDYFAAAALTGLLADPKAGLPVASYAAQAYQAARAMIRERSGAE